MPLDRRCSPQTPPERTLHSDAIVAGELENFHIMRAVNGGEIKRPLLEWNT